jgi:hypothetical protein
MKHIKNIVVLALFALQSFLAIAFFFSLGSSLFDSILLAGVGVLLETVKRISWDDAKTRRSIVAVVLGLALAAVSALASLGFELNSVRSSGDAVTIANGQRSDLTSQIAALDEESATIREKQAAIDPTWITSSMRLSSRLDDIRATRAQLSAKLESLPQNAAGRSASTLKMLCGIVHVDYDRSIILFFAALSIILEASVFVTMPNNGKRNARRKGRNGFDPPVHFKPLTPQAQEIVSSLSIQPARPRELADRLHKNPSTTRVALLSLLRRGAITRSDAGIYGAPPANAEQTA